MQQWVDRCGDFETFKSDGNPVLFRETARFNTLAKPGFLTSSLDPLGDAVKKLRCSDFLENPQDIRFEECL
jgi:hypothetical protein